jgi:hypothetical protein
MKLPASRLLAKPLTAAVDQVVRSRHEPAIESVRALRARRPTASTSDLAGAIIARYRRELGGMGAASGAVAAVPGIGTGLVVAGSVSETGWSVLRLGQMILELGAVHGYDARDVEERRAWVFAVLALALGVGEGLEQAAGSVVRRGGAAALKAMPAARVASVNRAVAGRLLVRWGSAQAAIRLGNVVPFGVGAAVGVGANVLLVNLVGSRARAFFDDAPLPALPAPSA